LRRIIPAFVAGALALCGSAASAQTTMTLRDRLVIVGSSSSSSLMNLLTRNFGERYAGVLPPVVQSLGSARALELFCTGIGPQTPDIVFSTRRMPRTIVETCLGNGVRDIVELQVGYGAVVIAARRGEPAPALTSRQVWAALAAEQPVNDEFVPNRARLWSDVTPGLPRTPIHVILPSVESGTHVLFDDLVMEAGCRQVKEIRLIFEANYRLSKCVTNRTDGATRVVPAVEVPAVLMAAPPGTLAVMTYDQLVASGGNFVALSLDGTVPTARTISTEEYNQVRSFYVYAKRQHGRNQSGVGVVRGIREFLDETTSEAAGGPGGYLTAAGLVPLGPAERSAQRRIALREILMNR
jgi:phosphate transport system substrate-binding protein